MDQAFDGRIRENLMGNLAAVPHDLWLWTPPGGQTRIVFDIVGHLGRAKYVYDNHAFGDQSMRWEKPETMPAARRRHVARRTRSPGCAAAPEPARRRRVRSRRQWIARGRDTPGA